MDNLEITRLPEEITAPPPEEVRTACHEDIPPRMEEVPKKRSRRSAIRQFLLVGAAAVTVATAALSPRAERSSLPQPDLDPACWETLNETMVAFQNEDIARVMELWDTPEAFGWYTEDLTDYRQRLVDEGYVHEHGAITYHNGQFYAGLSSNFSMPVLTLAPRSGDLLGHWSMSYAANYSYYKARDTVMPEESPLFADFHAQYDENGRLGCVDGEFWRLDGKADNGRHIMSAVPKAKATLYEGFHYDSTRLETFKHGVSTQLPSGYFMAEGTFVRCILDEIYYVSCLSDGTMQFVEANGLVHTLSVTDGFIDGAVTQAEEYNRNRTTVTDDRGMEWTFTENKNDYDVDGLPGQYLIRSFTSTDRQD